MEAAIICSIYFALLIFALQLAHEANAGKFDFVEFSFFSLLTFFFSHSLFTANWAQASGNIQQNTVIPYYPAPGKPHWGPRYGMAAAVRVSSRSIDYWEYLLTLPLLLCRQPQIFPPSRQSSCLEVIHTAMTFLAKISLLVFWTLDGRLDTRTMVSLFVSLKPHSLTPYLSLSLSPPLSVEDGWH